MRVVDLLCENELWDMVTLRGIRGYGQWVLKTMVVVVDLF
jgi:hypothetical protein